MKSLKLVLVSVSLSLCAAVAHAEDRAAQPAAADTVTLAQKTQDHSAHRLGFFHRLEARATKKTDDCVGPASFCDPNVNG